MQDRQEYKQPVLQPEISDGAFSELRDKLIRERGLDLGGYKDRCIKRRISVRLRAIGCASLDEYIKYVDIEPGELDTLVQTITINVSGFFRNPETFDFLRENIMPAVIGWRKKKGDAELNIWSAGCATGEEIYSLAIMLRQHFRTDVHRMRVFMAGTDFNETFLARARQGIYSPTKLTSVPKDIIKRYFREIEGNLQLMKKIRDMVTFEKHDLLEPFPYKGMDLILCRNVLIYFSREMQSRIFHRFREALRIEGFLILGKTESLLEPFSYGFRSVLPRERAYQKMGMN